METHAVTGTGAAPAEDLPSEPTKSGRKVHAAFTASFNAVFEVHAALGDAHASAGAADEDVCMSDGQIGTVYAAYKDLQKALEPSALPHLFAHVESGVMESFLNSCAQQARSGVGARHASLHQDVRCY